jgi:hypothetical protein
LIGSFAPPICRLCIVMLYTLTEGILEAKAVLRIRIALIRYFANSGSTA